VEAVIDGNFERVELTNARTHPFCATRPIADTN
jgi:hypothetical protein